jgi:hypothetical protein
VSSQPEQATPGSFNVWDTRTNPPEPTPWVNNLRPGGICPETTLNRTGFSEVRQSVVEKYHVLSVPTLPNQQHTLQSTRKPYPLGAR